MSSSLNSQLSRPPDQSKPGENLHREPWHLAHKKPCQLLDVYFHFWVLKFSYKEWNKLLHIFDTGFPLGWETLEKMGIWVYYYSRSGYVYFQGKMKKCPFFSAITCLILAPFMVPLYATKMPHNLILLIKLAWKFWTWVLKMSGICSQYNCGNPVDKFGIHKNNVTRSSLILICAIVFA